LPAIFFGGILLLQMNGARAEPVAVRHEEGLVHGFLSLRTLDGKNLANGDLLQTAEGGRVSSRLVFHFNDGSIHDETVVYSQRRFFRLLSFHLVQKGPAFRIPMDVTIEGDSGRMKVRYIEDGKGNLVSERLDLPADLANGLVPVLLKNLQRDKKGLTVSMAAATPKPLLVKLEISPEGEDTISIGNSVRKATRYRVKVNIGGVAGLFAHILNKQPPDTHVWILGGDVPAFLRSEGPLFLGGPIWRIDLTSPVWR